VKKRGDQFRHIPTPEEHRGPVQLPLFMPASDLYESLTATADNPWMPVEEVMEKKLERTKQPGNPHEGRATGTGVFQSVVEHGVVNPVQMIHTQTDIMMGHGHHRVAAADEIARMSTSSKPEVREQLSKLRPDAWVGVVHTDSRSKRAQRRQGQNLRSKLNPPINVTPWDPASEERRAAGQDYLRYKAYNLELP
jgi:hypothetical protein